MTNVINNSFLLILNEKTYYLTMFSWKIVREFWPVLDVNRFPARKKNEYRARSHVLYCCFLTIVRPFSCVSILSLVILVIPID